MLHLINLERRKIKLWGYVGIASVIILGLYTLIIIGFGFDKPQNLTLEQFSSLLASLITYVTLINASYIFSTLIVDEYEKKRVNELFTYPVSRKKIMKAKLVFIIGFPLILNIVLACILTSLTYLLHKSIPIIVQQGSIIDFARALSSTMYVYIFSPAMLVITCFIGLIKRSRGWATGMTIGVGTVMASNNEGFSLQSQHIIIVIIAVAAIGACYFGLIKNVECEDVE